MPDKSAQIVVDALCCAAAEPAGLPLHGSKANPGLFANTAPAKQAAQLCKEQGYLRVVRTEPRSKSIREVCALTDKGLAYVLEQVSPNRVLEALIEAVKQRHEELTQLTDLAERAQANLDTLRTAAETTLELVRQPARVNGFLGPAHGSDVWLGTLLAHLADWQTMKSSEDCPLPELYRRLQQSNQTLTIGHFHDGLRRLHEQEKLYLHPWSGPLYEIPEPQYALLVGHEIAYYASLRT